MKLLTVLLTIGLALTAPSFAGNKPGKEGKKGDKKEVMAALKAADKNGNNQIDADEVAGLEAAIKAAEPGSGLKALDTNGDGKLSDDELKAINARLAAKADGGKKKKNK